MRRRLLAIVLFLGFLATGGTSAWAHAILVESTPAIGAEVPAGDVALRLRFNSRVDRPRSRLTLIRADKSTTVIPIMPEGTDDLLLAKVNLPPGQYVVRWQVLAVDGHITRGDVPFTIKAN
jgi:methionine-rich copper-binding protein CopC